MSSPSPWGKLQNVDRPNFAEITLEQLAQSIQEKKIKKHEDSVIDPVTIPPVVPNDCELIEISQCESDEFIAHTLQLDYNQEHNSMLTLTEKKVNGDSKVNISYSNFRTNPGEPDDARSVPDEEHRDFDRFVSIEKEYASIPRCGYKKVGDGEGSQILTKHDPLMSSRINACRVLEFPPGIRTGDTGGFDVKLNNKVFNTLRAHSHAHCSKEKAKAHTKPTSK